MLRLLSLLVFLGATTPCLAQTAEETVAYFVHGFEEGSTFLDRKITAKRTSDVPAKYDVTNSDVPGVRFSLTVTKITECSYRSDIFIDHPDRGSVSVVRDLDFSAATGIPTITNKVPQVNLEGKRFFYVNGMRSSCKATRDETSICKEMLTNFGEESRIFIAYDYFRSNFCKRRAF